MVLSPERFISIIDFKMDWFKTLSGMKTLVGSAIHRNVIHFKTLIVYVLSSFYTPRGARKTKAYFYEVLGVLQTQVLV